MGEIRATLFLENEKDRILAEGGLLKENQVRKAAVDALVDTGAVMLLLPQDLVDRLGLVTDGKVIVTMEDERKVELQRARYLSLRIGDREMDTDCLVGPPQSEPLVGQLVLERLDLVLDPVKRTVGPRPESPFFPSLKLK